MKIHNLYFYIRGGPRLFALVLFISLTGCLLPNGPYHETSKEALSFNEEKSYDLAFLEFSEHGNLFNRRIYDELLKKIELAQRISPTALVVFIHGWHHNSHPDDTDLAGFEKLLFEISDTDIGPFQNHRVIGVYVGWRGSSLSIPLIEYLTFWDRKTVAEEVGRGGVTEVLLTLERVSRCGSRQAPCEERQNRKNKIVVLGHSFGGAIVLSALSDVFADKLINAKIIPEEACENEEGDKDGTFSQKRGAPCALAEPFGHGVILLNPAVEANQVLPLKELMSSFRYPDSQDVLMHVLSSKGDCATRWGFPIGQWLNNLTWREANILRDYEYDRENNISLVHFEDELTETAVGNFAPFRTGWIGGNPGEFSQCWKLNQRPNCKPGDETKRIPIGANEPIQFYLTDESFINGHNDVMNNCKVRSYILAIAAEAVSTQSGKYLSFKDHYKELYERCGNK